MNQLVPQNEIEQHIFELWQELTPSNAFRCGLAEHAGSFFDPTAENRERVLSNIRELRSKTTDEVLVGFLNFMETSILFEEPYMVPDTALWSFFEHMVKEGINEVHLMELGKNVTKALQSTLARLATQSWSTEVKIVTTNECNALLNIIATIGTESENLNDGLTELVKTVEDYRDKFYVEGIKEGDFTEIFPILEAQGGDIGRVEIYPRILKDMYAYTETPDEIEAKGLLWLKNELPRFKKITEELADIYGVEPTLEAVSEKLNEVRNIEKSKLLDFINNLRALSQNVIETHLVEITPNYSTKIIETPPYLNSLIPSAAMIYLDNLTDKPFNVFFITTDEKRSPPVNAAALFQMLIHEEYGHCVNFSNSATGFKAQPTLIELLESTLHKAISDGISFLREWESLQLIKRLCDTEEKNLTLKEQAFLGALKDLGELDHVILELEFIVMQWRIIRFLRAIGDVRINMHKQTIAEFVNWAHEETGLTKKLIFNQIFIFQGMVGYAPVYSIVGTSLQNLQSEALERGRTVRDFNTYASSLGFPPRPIFEERLRKF